MTSTKFVTLAVAALFTIGAAGAAGAQEKKAAKGAKCVIAGGEATMVTQDLAKFMAEAALKNSIKGDNRTASGAITLKCGPDSTGAMQYCKATQKACL